MLRWLSVLMITMPTENKLLLTAVSIVNWIAGCASFRTERKSVALKMTPFQRKCLFKNFSRSFFFLILLFINASFIVMYFLTYFILYNGHYLVIICIS